MNEENYNIENEEKIPEKNKKKKGFWGELLDWIVSIGVALIAVALINMFFFVQVMVDGSSMVPTLTDGDRLFASRFMYTPEQGDIVVLEPYLKEGSVKGKLMFGRTLYIKRVIAVGGQTVDIRDNGVFIDGERYKEAYLYGNVHTYEGSLKMPVEIPEGCVFVMGDNREHSKDSRDMSVGIIRNEQIVGKAVLQIYPFAEFGVIE